MTMTVLSKHELVNGLLGYAYFMLRGIKELREDSFTINFGIRYSIKACQINYLQRKCYYISKTLKMPIPLLKKKFS